MHTQLSETDRDRLHAQLSAALNLAHDPGVMLEPLLDEIDRWAENGAITTEEMGLLEASIYQWEAAAA